MSNSVVGNLLIIGLAILLFAGVGFTLFSIVNDGSNQKSDTQVSFSEGDGDIIISAKQFDKPVTVKAGNLTRDIKSSKEIISLDKKKKNLSKGDVINIYNKEGNRILQTYKLGETEKTISFKIEKLEYKTIFSTGKVKIKPTIQNNGSSGSGDINLYIDSSREDSKNLELYSSERQKIDLMWEITDSISSASGSQIEVTTNTDSKSTIYTLPSKTEKIETILTDGYTFNVDIPQDHYNISNAKTWIEGVGRDEYKSERVGSYGEKTKSKELNLTNGESITIGMAYGDKTMPYKSNPYIGDTWEVAGSKRTITDMWTQYLYMEMGSF